MKIVHVVESFAGGVLDFLVDLTQGIPEHRHIIIHGVRKDTPLFFENLFPPDVTFYPWRHAQREISLSPDIRAFSALVSTLNRHRDADIVHLHSSKAGVHGRIACRIVGLRRRVIYTPHGASFLRKDVSSAARRMYTFIERTAATAAGIVVACSSSEAEEFRKVGINSTFISSGIRCGTSASQQAPGSRLVVGTVGRITTPKDPALFSEIASSFIHDPTVSFLWIGDGELRHMLTSPNISVTGWLGRGEVADRLHGINIYLSTSRWEGMPLSVLMAMCAGKPLVLSACVGNRDLVADGKNGFLFHTKDEAVQAVKSIQNDIRLAQVMGTESRRRAMEEFSLSRMADEYRALYNSISG